MIGRRIALGALLVTVVAGGITAGASLPLDRESGEKPIGLRARLDAIVDSGAPGVIALTRDDANMRQLASGLANPATHAPMRPSNRFRIASVTKTFVATVVLRLVSEGRLGLDDSVERWLPGLIPNGRRVTVRQLLGHRSGLFDYTDDSRVFQPYWSQPRFVWTPRRLIALAASHPVVFSPPGSRFAYSSTNYLVLGLIVERATGKTLARELRDRIFRPLGLHDTMFVPGPWPAIGEAHGFRSPSHDGVVSASGAAIDTSAYSASWMWAAGGIVSSADDLARFFAALLGGRVLAPRLLRTMETTAPPRRYGLGLAVFRTRCGAAWGHTGNALGYVTAVWNTKDGRRQIVLMVNSYPFSAATDSAVRRALVSAFCDEPPMTPPS
jgi:D-alanyl-D-alanine carboxypeptidase